MTRDLLVSGAVLNREPGGLGARGPFLRLVRPSSRGSRTCVPHQIRSRKARPPPRGLALALLAATVFLSAFLLFQVQPIIGKYILPWFGATPGVWATTLLFFQLMLLCGYAYAHFLVSRLTWQRQAILHAVLLGLALITLPITPGEGLKPIDADAPVRRILLILTLSVGAPYLLLSATAPLIQRW